MKTNRIILYSLVGIAAFVFASCSNFLDVKPKGIVIPEKLEDYEAMLFSHEMTLTYPPALLDAADDYYDEFDEVNTSVAANAYYWRPGLDPTELVPPAIWGDYYTCIYYCNVIINQVMSANSGTDEKKQQIIAEAQVTRASAYFHLLTAFAKVYRPESAATDPGLPLMTSTNVTDQVPPRSTLEEVVQTILNDVSGAIEHLPVDNESPYRVNKNAAYAFLSRVYLYLGDYDKAGQYASQILDQQPSLLDYNNYESSFDMPDAELSPENIWMQGCSDYSVPGFMNFSADLLSYYDAHDKRFLMLANDDEEGHFYYYGPGGGRDNLGITLPEIYLTKAEVLARQGDLQGALQLLNTLRKNRIETSAYTDEQSTDAVTVLQLVLAERRRELAFRGVRWMDMKRLDREGLMPAVERKDEKSGYIRARLEPGSKAYTFQIPSRVQQFNPDIQLNDQ